MPVLFEKKELETVLDHYLDDLADAIFARSQENIVKAGMTDKGTLLVTANINRNYLNKEIVYPVEYAVWLEWGTLPHAVSAKGRQNIAEWAQRKLGLSEKESQSAAWGICQKIRRHGQEPRPFLRPAVDEIVLHGVKA